jgi:CRP-like cAMP-binding protein
MNETNEIEKLLTSFLQTVFDVSKIDQNLIRFLSLQSTLVEYPKKTILSKEGSNHKYIFIVKNGFIRRHTLIDGKDITLEFAKENEMITSMSSIVTSNPTKDFIETVEDSIVLKLNSEYIKKLYDVSDEAPLIGNLLRDRYFLSLENRIRTLQLSSAKKRYNKLIKEQPHIIQRASLGQIASYLGMTQENLSRIRAKK